VDLNLFIWEQLARESCKLLVDANEGDQAGYLPGYYVNRIEELIRRCDLFISVLTYREPRGNGASTDGGCSPYCLFEVRLAERARRPRLILYDDRIRVNLRPRVGQESTLIQYLPFRRFDFEHGDGRARIEQQIQHWLSAVSAELSPHSYQTNTGAVILMPDSLRQRNRVTKKVQEALAETPFREVFEVRDEDCTDAHLMSLFASSPLIVAEVGASPIPTAYAMAHALFLPAVRLFRGEAPKGALDDVLPWPLKGHAGGYQEDIVWWTKPDQVYEGVKNHAKSMEQVNRTITTQQEGISYFEKRRYADHHVFISHDLKADDQVLVRLVVEGLQRKSIDCWEYSTANRAAEDWLTKLKAELNRATHAILFVSDTYEQSQHCDAELTALRARKVVGFVPFFIGSRRRPLVHLGDHLHYEPLIPEQTLAANQVVERMIAVLSAKVASA
jgi:hypothetical protein